MIANLVGGSWQTMSGPSLPVFDPATGDIIDTVPLGGATEVDEAVQAATSALPGWSATSVMDRTRLMFRFRELLDSHHEELAAIITRHHGKTLAEARGEVRRGIEVVDFACGAPTLLQGRVLREVAEGLDQTLHRFPVGVVAGIPPFNFPVMIPLWMFPLAVVCGNTFVLKPSERTPLGAMRLAELFTEAGFPDGVLNVVHGAADTVNALLEHPGIAAVSFVGSEAVARHVYTEAARHGKRVQALGGAKNHVVVMPDADLEKTIPALLDSAFGNAGERCLAGSVVVAVGGVADTLVSQITKAARAMVVGPGHQAGVQVGPLIRAEHRDRVIAHIEGGVAEGAHVVVDGREYVDRPGFFLGPTVLDDVTPDMAIGRDEIFGPVLSVARAETLDEAITQANAMSVGNMAVIFTQSGRSAREFQNRVEAGMVGVNVSVAQPLAFFPFSGWKRSFYGDLHVHGTDGIDFYTRKKVVVSRW